MLMLADGQSKLPVYSQNLSGNIQDKSSFAEVVRTRIPILKEQYRELKYLVGDSALCTAASFKATENKDYFLVTRVPDTQGQVKRCMAEIRKEELIPIFPDDLKSPLGKWVDEFELEPLINSAIGKVGSHVVVDSGALIKLLVMQQLNVPYQSLSGTEEYDENRLVGAFLN